MLIKYEGVCYESKKLYGRPIRRTTVAINASLRGVIEGVSSSNQYHTVYGALNGITGILNNEFLNLTELMDEHPDYMDRLTKTPAMFLGSCRYKLPSYMDDDSPYVFIFKQFENYNVVHSSISAEMFHGYRY